MQLSETSLYPQAQLLVPQFSCHRLATPTSLTKSNHSPFQTALWRFSPPPRSPSPSHATPSNASPNRAVQPLRYLSTRHCKVQQYHRPSRRQDKRGEYREQVDTPLAVSPGPAAQQGDGAPDHADGVQRAAPDDAEDDVVGAVPGGQGGLGGVGEFFREGEVLAHGGGGCDSQVELLR
ncbi:hypothetical protein VTI74DRAFT_9123 [Chaetomium olivicolor]